MRTKTFQTVISGKMNERLVLVAINTGRRFTEAEEDLLRTAAQKKIGGGIISTHTVRIADANLRGETFAIFENYLVEQATIIERLGYCFRKLRAAALAYIGINTVRIVVVSNADPLVMNKTTPVSK